MRESAPSAAPGPLAGVRVVDCSRVLAAPYLSMLLGDLGAEVVKVEKPAGGDQTRGWGPPFVGPPGDRVSAYFLSANRDKRSLALDLGRPEGRRVFSRLLESADLLVENFLPGEWKKLGFAGNDFTRHHPRLVQVTVTSYGTAGPEADRPAYDVVLQAESGLMSLTGLPDGEPVRVGVAIVDFLSGLYALGAALAALHVRDAGAGGGSGGAPGARTRSAAGVLPGEAPGGGRRVEVSTADAGDGVGIGPKASGGRRVEVSMADAGAAFLSYAGQSWLADGRQPPRLGSRHPNLAPYQAFATADGWIVVAVGSDGAWRRLCTAVGRPELAADPRFADNRRRVENRDELDRRLAEVFATRPTAEWQRVLAEHRVPCGPVAEVGEAVAAARQRGQVTPLPEGAYGPLDTLAAPWLFDQRRTAPRRPPPAFGEHTVEVLAEAGLSAEEIRRLLAEGVAVQHPGDGGR